MTTRTVTSLFLAICVAVIGGCVAIPTTFDEPRVVEGTLLSAEDVSFVVPGVTSREEIENKFGHPTISFPEHRIAVHAWRIATGAWHGALISMGPALPFTSPILRRDALVIFFDDVDRVRKLGFAKGESNEPLLTIAMRWAQEQGLALRQSQTQLAERTPPTGKSLLYVYRPGRWWLFGLDMLNLVELSVDGTLVAELRPGTYYLSIFEPGPHRLSVTYSPSAKGDPEWKGSGSLSLSLTRLVPE